MEEKLTKDEKKAIRQEEWKEKADRERKMGLYKTIGYWSFGGLLVILAIWGLAAFSSGNSSTSSTTLKAPAITAEDFQTGPSTAKATLIEYADFQCPACKAYYPLLKQLEIAEQGKVNFVYRMFPLKTVHQNALSSARAAYAASKQNKFWDMHDKLFINQDSWANLSDPENTFISYAKDLSLNTDQFKKDYESDASFTYVSNAYSAATNLGLNGTPTFFLNGKQIDNPQSYQAFKDLVDGALK